MNVACPRCRTVYRVDPRKVPARGVRARCSACSEVFAVEAAAATAPPEAPAPTPVAPPAPEPAPGLEAPSFGVADPQARARRLARALVSDMLVYHPERRARALANGTLRQEFRDEVRKSWDEYVGQVGEEVAHSSAYFRDALNEILAGGARVF